MTSLRQVWAAALIVLLPAQAAEEPKATIAANRKMLSGTLPQREGFSVAEESTMKRINWITLALACLMVLLALGGASMGTQAAGNMLAAAAGLAVVLSWLIAKMEKPLLLLGLSVGATAALSVCILLNNTDAMKRFILSLVMLLAIIWLVSSMIRRHLTKAE